MSTSPIIAIIHANAATMSPVESAFADTFPNADLWHLLDDRLVSEAERAGGLTDDLGQRMATLIRYAVDAGADAVQLACSMYGPVVVAVSHSVPVLASDQAMFEDVIQRKPGHVTILASLGPAAQDTAARLGAALAEAGQRPRIEALVVPEAKAASDAGNLEELERVVADAARMLDATDLLVLAQYSLAPALARVVDVVDVPVLSGPHLAAATLAVDIGATQK